jgi:hypothetical protein
LRSNFNPILAGILPKSKPNILIGDKTSLVWLRKGKGEIILFGFSPLFRASAQVAYKLLFNALLLQKKT